MKKLDQGRGLFFGLALACLLVLSAAVPVNAQQVTGTLGSPNATTTIDPKYLPAAPPEFGGIINLDAKQSKPWWPPRVVPPKGAPNVLLIMTDDAGYGVPSTFGGVIPTPALDRVAKMGLRYTQFHSTALCSPTRAALICGRNHHSVGFGVVTEASTGYPGYDSIIGPENATIAEILKENGYATSWFGKEHNTPGFQYSIAGPFDQWPVGMGFEYFYGFMGGNTDQWTPYLFRNTSQIYPWVGKPGWNLTTAMADDAIKYLQELNAAAPDKPFFLYYVPGGTHSPHQPTPEWIEKISAMHLFDKGWNALRETIYANQKQLGVIPPGTELTPWPDILPKWDTLSAGEYSMGCNVPSEGVCTMATMNAVNDAQPIHRVYVDGFWMDETDVTKTEFESSSRLRVISLSPSARRPRKNSQRRHQRSWSRARRSSPRLPQLYP